MAGGKLVALVIVWCIGMALMIGTFITVKHICSKSHDHGKDENKLILSNKVIVDICKPTRYQETCEKSLTSSSGNDTDPKELVKMAFKLAKEEVAFALNRSKAIRAAANDPRAKQGLEICHEVINYAVGDLERSLESMGNFSYSNLDDFLEDLSVWIGGAATYQDAYFDAFDNATSNAGLKMRELFNTSRQLTSISLSMVSEIKQLVSTLNIPILLGGRHLLQETAALPQARALLAWISAQRCNIMKTPISTLQKKWN